MQDEPEKQELTFDGKETSRKKYQKSDPLLDMDATVLFIILYQCQRLIALFI